MTNPILSFLKFLVFGPRLNIVPVTTAPGNLGAKLWDESTQGSDHTRMPGQPPLIAGGPENVVFGPVGTLCVDATGVLYVKTTDVTLPTGWKTVTHA